MLLYKYEREEYIMKTLIVFLTILWFGLTALNNSVKADEYNTAVIGHVVSETIKESYFGKQEAKSNDIDDVAVSDGSTVEPADLTNSMAAYSAAISKTKDVKLSIK